MKLKEAREIVYGVKLDEDLNNPSVRRSMQGMSSGDVQEQRKHDAMLGAANDAISKVKPAKNEFGLSTTDASGNTSHESGHASVKKWLKLKDDGPSQEVKDSIKKEAQDNLKRYGSGQAIRHGATFHGPDGSQVHVVHIHNITNGVHSTETHLIHA